MDAIGFGLIALGALLLYSAIRNLHPWKSFTASTGINPQLKEKGT